MPERNKVNALFDKLSEKGEKALICYVVGGYPDIETSKEIVSTLIESGADIIEIGIPFSDPMADGPIIQAASLKALARGITPSICFRFVNEMKKNTMTHLLFL